MPCDDNMSMKLKNSVPACQPQDLTGLRKPCPPNCAPRSQSQYLVMTHTVGLVDLPMQRQIRDLAMPQMVYLKDAGLLTSNRPVPMEMTATKVALNDNDTVSMDMAVLKKSVPMETAESKMNPVTSRKDEAYRILRNSRSITRTETTQKKSSLTAQLMQLRNYFKKRVKFAQNELNMPRMEDWSEYLGTLGLMIVLFSLLVTKVRNLGDCQVCGVQEK